MDSLACCFTTDEDREYVCENRRIPTLPMCEKHTLWMFREAMTVGVLPDDVFREIVQHTEARIELMTQMRRFEDLRALRDHREKRAAKVQAGRDNPIVYYVRLTGDRIKIGWTTNLDQRLRTYRARAADLLAIEPGGYDVETKRHRQFAHLRIGRSEDFRAEPDLLAHTQRIAAAT